MSSPRLCALLVGLTLFAGCSHPPADTKTQKAEPQRSADAPQYDQSARFLAGLKGRDGSPYKALEARPEWQNYAKRFDDLWSQSQSAQLSKVAAFEKANLDSLETSSYVFYPFSGPDVLYATAFFPKATHYVLAAQEPVGTVRKPSDYKPDALGNDLEAWSNALYSIFHRSFFVTGEMSRHFHGRVADGMLETMLLMLARTGHVIDDVHYVRLDENGKLSVDRETPINPGAEKHPGVQILFHKENDPTPRTLEYYSTDLAPGFQTNPALSRYLTSLGHPDAFIKSASFLLHWKMCDPIRTYLLKEANLIVQDDTGVPYNYFIQSKDWDVYLFGKYSRPDPPFRKQYQKSLAAAFEDGSTVKPLGFNIGYGSGYRPSSLIVAKRKNVESAATPVKTASAPLPASK